MHDSTPDPPQLIVGLGNPGPAYAGNRHNAGLWFLRRLCADYRGELRLREKFHGEVGKIRIGGREIHLLWPVSFMNLSGRAVAAVGNYYRIEPERMLIACDEIDFPAGTVRFKSGGGHGGHNGLRSIIESLGGRNAFRRLRIGVGHPGDKSEVIAYVLGDPPATERESIDRAIANALDVMPAVAAGEWEAAMRILHTAN